LIAIFTAINNLLFTLGGTVFGFQRNQHANRVITKFIAKK